MHCPACLLFGVERATTTHVDGTEFCGQHGQEALLTAGVAPTVPGAGPRRGRPVRPERQFTPPVE